MSEIIISAKNIMFHVPVFKPTELKFKVNPIRLVTQIYKGGASRQTKTLLDDVSFELRNGQNLGILGRNGAGKTTLLQLLAGIYMHNSGELNIVGKAQGLFNVQYGMNPAATGFENIYLRGLQMGLELQEIRELIPEVVEFSGIDDAINETFATYSTGMRLRLAVAISTMIKPDILLMDEWIGSGDAQFREKVNRRMKDLMDNSQGLVLASHNDGLLKSVCTHGLVLSHGRVVYYGAIKDAVNFYRDGIQNKEL